MYSSVLIRPVTVHVVAVLVVDKGQTSSEVIPDAPSNADTV
jgi:hypothetical protein